jgi:hypothetical protein
MWIIEHSTTPPDVVNSLPLWAHSGTKSPKNTVHITAFRLPRMPQPAPHPARLPYATLDPGSQNFLKPNVAYARARFSWALNLFF